MSRRSLKQYLLDAFSPTSLDLARAIRCTIGFMAPLVFESFLPAEWEAGYISLVALNVAMADIRGSYPLRVAVLVLMSLVFAVTGAVGGLAAGNVLACVLLAAGFSVVSGLWRHLSSEYGDSLGTVSLLVLFLTLGETSGWDAAKQHFISLLIGGGFGLLLQTAFWPFRPQHPLRRTAAESWLAAADLLETLAGGDDGTKPVEHGTVAARELALREAVDRVALVLIQTSSKNRGFTAKLEDLNLAAARLSVRVMALQTALEGAFAPEALRALQPTLFPFFTNLKNICRSVGVTVVSRNPSHLAAMRVRAVRASGLLRVVRQHLRDGGGAGAQLEQIDQILSSLGEQIPRIAESLARTVDRAGERAAFPLELFDLNTWMLRPLASTLNLRRKVDPALVRHVMRLSLLTPLGVLVMKLLHLSYGFWLPFTSVVVLQPDYGSTRQRAGHRAIGTVVGTLFAGVLIWLGIPWAASLVVTGIAVFCFSYVTQRDATLGVFFVTIFVVLLIETGGSREFAPVLERTLATLVGSALALGASALLWPLWEKRRFPGLMASALRANAEYIERLGQSLGQPADTDERKIGKMEAERANSEVFSSVRRMLGDPENQRERVEQAAALANGNQRLTRVMNLILVRLQEMKEPTPVRPSFFSVAPQVLRDLAGHVELGPAHPASLERLLGTVAALRGPRDTTPPMPTFSWITSQTERAATELAAIVAAADAEWSDESATILNAGGGAAATSLS